MDSDSHTPDAVITELRTWMQAIENDAVMADTKIMFDYLRGLRRDIDRGVEALIEYHMHREPKED